ncbi:aldehyde dehydrogenase family protein [Pseudomonas mediterranea]|uniref:aldehyde dehydrogenase family protein n=1 Tax=Pseudomonas mediterranea TaxID=183795 RepID=UPI001318622F|nr:aldehyde dehydrogenase family protein [Pseudomonas mediterranea]QHA82837.1 aldehyde dehydrogenase family protein [Pseudomonas mediterranea]
MIAFTGSVPTGQKIMQGATERMKPLLLELGSSDPFIVLDDADFDMAVQAATFAAFLNCGQVCTGSERFFIHEKIYDDFMEALVQSVSRLRIGDPLGDVDIGPLINKGRAQWRRRRSGPPPEPGRENSPWRQARRFSTGSFLPANHC